MMSSYMRTRCSRVSRAQRIFLWPSRAKNRKFKNGCPLPLTPLERVETCRPPQAKDNDTWEISSMPVPAQAGTLLVGTVLPYTGWMIQDTGDYLTLWLLGLADFWLTPGQDACFSLWDYCWCFLSWSMGQNGASARQIKLLLFAIE